jgi:hypothetical protein
LEIDPMRLLVLAALAALTFGGQAAAQSQPLTDHGGGAALDYPFQGTDSYGQPLPARHSPAAEAVYRQMHFACEADQKALCASKAGPAIGHCLRNHVKTVSPSCKQAIIQARRADAGRL